VTPYSLADIYRRFRETCYIRIQGRPLSLQPPQNQHTKHIPLYHITIKYEKLYNRQCKWAVVCPTGTEEVNRIITAEYM
jgi:hypothetical protein